MKTALVKLLLHAARQGRWVLVAGLCIGLTAPALARYLQPFIPQMVVVLLFLAVLRMEVGNVLGSLREFGQTLGTVLILQLILPLLLVVVSIPLINSAPIREVTDVSSPKVS